MFRGVKPALFHIEERGDDTRSAVGSLIVGTAFVYAQGLLATAAHVVEGAIVGDLRVRSSYASSGEYGIGMPHRVQSVFLHPECDFALLKVHQNATASRPTFEFGSAEVGALVTIPGYAEGTGLVWIDDILGRGAPKSISPVQTHGYIAARIPDDGVQSVQAYAYDASTFAGQSGSPVFDVASKRIVAVHTHGYARSVGYGLATELLAPFFDDVAAGRVPAMPILEKGVDVPCSRDPAPDDRKPEKDLKLGGRLWRIHKNDPDPLPSSPHAHLLGTRLKLHLATGQLFLKNKVVGKIAQKELEQIRDAAVQAGIVVP
ncbi:MAG: serine protease [Patescibacteria group bacterium]